MTLRRRPIPSEIPAGWRLFWLGVTAAHAVLAGAWVILRPGSFPMSHPQFWANRVLPGFVGAVVIASMIARFRRNAGHFAVACAALAPMWVAAAVATCIVFPVSFARIGPPACALGFVLTMATWFSLGRRVVRRAAVALAVLGAAAGATGVALQRGADPGTHPVGAAIDQPPLAADDPVRTALRFGQGDAVIVSAGEGSFTFHTGRVMFSVQPLLTFASRSPDRCWSIFASARDRVGPARRLLARRADAAGATLDYADDGPSRLTFAAPDAIGTVLIDAQSSLPAAVYSHLNSFCELGIYGHKRLSVTFSPCPAARVEFVPSDYPVGRPQRSAYLDAAGVFHVVEARSAEKGPFRQLAAGALRRDEPLVLTLFDEDVSFACLTLDDFAAQADTSLSPTAGWGLPTNAIEFSLYGDRPGAQAGLTVTLAGTSVGRGWDTVGHAAGVYRNRMRVEVLRGDGESAGQ